MNRLRRALARVLRRAAPRRPAVPLCLALLAAAVACSGDGPAPPDRSPTATASPSPTASPPPAVTPAEAARVVAADLAADDVARAAGDERLGLMLSRDGQTPITIARFRSTDMRPPRYEYGTPTVLVPRNRNFPHWFAATVERRGEDGERALMVLVYLRVSEQANWQRSFASLVTGGSGLPAVHLDAEGYATALSTRDESIAISPHLMAPVHATAAEEGTQGYAAGLIAPGPLTTDYATEIAARQSDAKENCLHYDSIFAASTYPVFALRTEDGGALIMYSLTRTTTWTAKVEPCAQRIAVPDEARWALGRPFARKELRVQEIQQYVSVAPPKTARTPARVIGFEGAVTRATGG